MSRKTDGETLADNHFFNNRAILGFLSQNWSHNPTPSVALSQRARHEAFMEDAYGFELRGKVDVKGVGKVKTWFLTGVKT